MPAYESIINLLSYAVFMLGTVFVWPSKRNFILWLSFPFFITAYVFPLLAVNFSAAYSSADIQFLTNCNLIGALSFLSGLVFGALLKFKFKWSMPLSFGEANINISTLEKKVFWLTVFGCLGMSFCFLWMGMVPMFSEQPFYAKFFRGPYKEKYDQISIIYRFSQAVLITVMPFCFALLLDKRRLLILAPLIWALLLFIGALTRSEVGAGLMIYLMAWSTKNRLRFTFFVIFSMLLYGFANLIYFMLGFGSSDSDMISVLMSGATDIADQLSFISKFNPSNDLTYGLTFLGGLIPGNFKYNPSVYTLMIANGSDDVSSMASGGFRLPLSLAGYMAFSWFGVVLVPFVVGLITGMVVRVLKMMPFSSIFHIIIVMMWFKLGVSFWIEFYNFTYGKLISFAILFFLLSKAFYIKRYVAKNGS